MAINEIQVKIDLAKSFLKNGGFSLDELLSAYGLEILQKAIDGLEQSDPLTIQLKAELKVLKKSEVEKVAASNGLFGNLFSYVTDYFLPAVATQPQPVLVGADATASAAASPSAPAAKVTAAIAVAATSAAARIPAIAHSADDLDKAAQQLTHEAKQREIKAANEAFATGLQKAGFLVQYMSGKDLDASQTKAATVIAAAASASPNAAAATATAGDDDEIVMITPQPLSPSSAVKAGL